MFLKTIANLISIELLTTSTAKFVAAVSIWRISEEFKECEKLQKDSFESVKTIKEAVQQAEEILKNVTEANEAVQAVRA